MEQGKENDRQARRYDLHSHSVFSDGSHSVDELIEQARAAGLAGLAITDHDTFAHIPCVRARARALKFPVLAGLEVSAVSERTGRKIHILCFGAQATADGSGPLERIVADTLARRTGNTLWQAWTIMNAHERFPGRAPLSLDVLVQTAAPSGGVYKQHVMEAMSGLPYTDPAYQKLYRRLFKNGGIAQRDIRYPEACEVVRAAREQGAVPVLAHPGQMDSWSMIPDLVEAGLQGIEAHHPDHTAIDVDRARRAATDHGLFMTGGSDFHGRYGAPRALGCCGISAEEAGEPVADLFAREVTLR